MENSTFTFKTTMQCASCVAKVAPVLEGTPAILSWSVDTTNADKILTVNATDISAQEIEAIVASRGFTAEEIK